jgi:sensor domain CHASE-containing protein/signal transduction histidine kinase
MIAVILSLWIVTQTVLMSGFAKVEKDDTIRNAERVRDAVNGMIENIAVKASDWAKWDDTYRFVIDHNKEYIASNLTDESLAELQLDLIVILDTSRSIVFSKQHDSDLELEMPLTPEIRSIISTDNCLTYHTTSGSILSGIFTISGKPMLIVSRPILNSQGKGPIHGTIVFGKFFDSSEINSLQQLTHLSIKSTNYDSSQWSDLWSSYYGFSSDSSIIIKPLDKNSIAGYFIVNDIHKTPALTLEINLPRDIYRQGINTNLYLFISIIIAGLILSFVIITLLETVVIRRIAKLNTDVDAIKKTSDNSARVSIDGKDEITNFASSVNNMLAALQTKEMIIQNRNNEMRLLMNSIPIGLLSFNEKFEVNPEYSSSVEDILEQSDIAGKKFLDVFGFDKEDATIYQGMIDFLEILQQDLIPEQEITALNPCEELNYRHGSISKWLRLRYFLIERGKGIPKHVLVAIENITDKKALAERVTISEKENLQLRVIAEDPDLFRELLSEIQQILGSALERIQSCNKIFSQEMIRETFRDVHTIKGSAGAFGLITIVEIAASLEDQLSDLSDVSEIDAATVNQIQDAFFKLQSETLEIIDKVKELFGDEFNDNSDIHLRIPLERIKSGFLSFDHILQAEQLNEDQYQRIRDRLKVHFVDMRQVPAKRGLAKALKTAPGVIHRLHKDITFIIKGSEVPLDCEIAKDLNTPLIHLIRNSLDHGIEASEEQRISAGKTSSGNVSVSIEKTSDWIIVEVSDDGKGMDPEYIKNSAIKKGFITAEKASKLTYDEAIALILLPGFSTTEKVSEISGRGVGMDAVNVAVKEVLHGNLSITSQIGIGTTFRIKVPCGESYFTTTNS